MNAMARSVQRLSYLAATVLILGIAGCAAAGTGAETGSTTLIVENDLIPSTSLSIYAVPENGGRQLIGRVNPGATARLRFDPVAGGVGQFRFMAEGSGPSALVSNPITFSEGDTIQWDLNTNFVNIMR